jgi:hypothetical protein
MMEKMLSGYQITHDLLEEVRSSLPSIEAIEAELAIDPAGSEYNS